MNGQITTVLSATVVDSSYEEVGGSAANKSGMVVGTESYDGGMGVAFMYTKAGGMQAFPTPYSGPGVQTSGNSVNDAGLIVGSTTGGPPGYIGQYARAYLSDGHSSWDLNTLISPGSGLLLTDAFDINDLGQILGRAIDSQGDAVNYLLTPTTVPEPTSFLIVATGMMCLGVLKMGRRIRSTASRAVSLN